MTVADFITRWSQSGGAEIANSQSFLKELCTLLDVPQPDPTQAYEARNTYTFEKAVKISNGDGSYSEGRLDLYRQGCFVLESKQGTEQREAELEELLAEKSKSKKVRKGHAERETSLWVLVMQRAKAGVSGMSPVFRVVKAPIDVTCRTYWPKLLTNYSA